MDIENHANQSRSDEQQVSEFFAEGKTLGVLWFYTVARRSSSKGRVSNVVANLCVEGKLDSKSGIDI